MSASIGGIFGFKDSIEFKLALTIIGIILAVVIVSLLLDGIRKFIRGLDIAALGVLIIWLGHKASKIALISVVTKLVNLIGITLLIVGILVFVLLRLIRSGRSSRKKREIEVDSADDKSSDETPETPAAENE